VDEDSVDSAASALPPTKIQCFSAMNESEFNDQFKDGTKPIITSKHPKKSWFGRV
jgi:hypothetical protein